LPSLSIDLLKYRLSTFSASPIYERVKNIETSYLSTELERINDEINSSAPAVNDLIHTTSKVADELQEMKDFLAGFNDSAYPLTPR
jgi:hypothetical protein